MFRVRREATALDELTSIWMAADSPLRRAITAATHQIDYHLATDPRGQGESRPGGRRVLFVTPLRVMYRIEPDGQTVSVLSVWLFRKRARP